LGAVTGIIGSATGAGGIGGAALDVAGTYEFSEESIREQKTPVAKAIRAALISASNYVARKDSCIRKYNQRDKQRRERTQDVLELQ